MDLNFNQADIDFRNEVRDFIKTSYTSEMKAELRRSKNGSASKDLHVKWQKSLYEKGWIAPNWPVEHGGPCLLYTSPSPRDGLLSRMPSSA